MEPQSQSSQVGPPPRPRGPQRDFTILKAFEWRTDRYVEWTVNYVAGSGFRLYEIVPGSPPPEPKEPPKVENKKVQQLNLYAHPASDNPKTPLMVLSTRHLELLEIKDQAVTVKFQVFCCFGAQGGGVEVNLEIDLQAANGIVTITPVGSQ
jgi:hypothetical protein